MTKRTYENHLGPDRTHRAGDILVQDRVSRLPHWRVIFLAADEEVGRVDASDVEDGVDGHFDWKGVSLYRDK
jgi:hypothetical protein